MLSRRTMQIRPYPLGDTKWLQPQQNLQRGVCVCRQYVRISNKSVPPAICRQIGQLEQKNNINNNKKKENETTCLKCLTECPFKLQHQKVSLLVLGKYFLTCRSCLWQTEPRWMPNMDTDPNSSVGFHKFNFKLYLMMTWLKSRWKGAEARNQQGDANFHTLDFRLLESTWCESGTKYLASVSKLLNEQSCSNLGRQLAQYAFKRYTSLKTSGFD